MTKLQPLLRLEFVALVLIMSSSCEGCDDRVLPPPPPPDAAERFARAACLAEANCGCGIYSSTQECEADLTERFEDALAGGTIDEDCFEQYLESEVLQGCPSHSLLSDAIPGCVALVGSSTKGEPCLPFSLLTMLPGQGCQDGLFCSFEGVCGDNIQSTKAAGDPCNPDFPLSCGYELYCSAAGVCVARVPEGQSCDEPLACELGLFCDGLPEGAGVCAPQVEVGESCDPAEIGSCDGSSPCYAATLQCDENIPFACMNLAFLP